MVDIDFSKSRKLIRVSGISPQTKTSIDHQFNVNTVALSTQLAHELNINSVLQPPGSPSSWFAADKETSYSDNDAVTSLTDFGSLGKDLAQGTPADQPIFQSPGQTGFINEKPAIDFTGGGTKHLQVAFDAAISQGLTVAMVFRRDSLSGTYMFDGADATDRCAVFDGVGMERMWAGSFLSLTTAAPLGGWRMGVFVFDNTSSLGRLDGTETTGTAGANSLGGITLGARYTGANGFSGMIAEFIVYSDTSYGTESDIENYFQIKYGSLPQT